MKKIIILLVFFISTVGFAQINSFNETTQLLNKPHGKPVLQINAGVEYWYHNPGYEDAWAEIEVPCYVLKTAVEESAVLKGTKLFDYTGNYIGIVLNNTKCNAEYPWHGPSKSCPDSLRKISITGYVEEEKVNEKVIISEIMKTNKGVGDSCVSREYVFYNTLGEPQKIQENCNMYFTWIGSGPSPNEEICVKEKTTTLSLFGADCEFRSMTVEIIKNFATDQPKSYFISQDAYKCEFNYNKIVFYEYNWSAGPEEKYLYSASSFKKLMDFHGDLYSVMIPETEITGFIGYLPNPYEQDSTYYGNLCFATPDRVVLNKQIVCRNKELVKKLTCFDARIKFVPVNKNDAVSNYDSTLFLLKSKSGCAMENCLTDFRIIMSLGYDMYDISLELEFRDGDVFIVKNYMNAFQLR